MNSENSNLERVAVDIGEVTALNAGDIVNRAALTIPPSDVTNWLREHLPADSNVSIPETPPVVVRNANVGNGGPGYPGVGYPGVRSPVGSNDATFNIAFAWISENLLVVVRSKIGPLPLQGGPATPPPGYPQYGQPAGFADPRTGLPNMGYPHPHSDSGVIVDAILRGLVDARTDNGWV